MIDQIQSNPDCVYETPFNDLIRKDNYVPSQMSVILKKGMIKTGVNEIMAGRIYNYFGVKTSYDMPVNVDGNMGVLSVDVVGDGQTIQSFLDLGIPLEYILEIDVKNIANKLYKLYKYKRMNSDNVVDAEEFEKCVENFVESYIYEFLVKRYVVGDTDVHVGNANAIIDEQFRVLPCPVLDKELSFIMRHWNKSEMLRNLTFVRENYPRVYKRFQNKVQEFSSMNDMGEYEYVRVLDKNMSILRPYSADGIKYVAESLNNVKSACVEVNHSSFAISRYRDGE